MIKFLNPVMSSTRIYQSEKITSLAVIKKNFLIQQISKFLDLLVIFLRKALNQQYLHLGLYEVLSERNGRGQDGTAGMCETI